MRLVRSELRGVEHPWIGLEPEFSVGIGIPLFGDSHADRGHEEEWWKFELVLIKRQDEFAVTFAQIDHFIILAPTFGDRYVANIERRVHAARDPAHDQIGDVE